MGKIIEATHVALGGEQGDNAWARPYLNDEHCDYSGKLLNNADTLLLGRVTYEGLSAAYTAMGASVSQEPDDFGRFVLRMNEIPKLVASKTLAGGKELPWNAKVIERDVVEHLSELKEQSGRTLLKYGNGPLSATLARHNLIDEFHLFLTPVAVGSGKCLFSDIDWAPHLKLLDLTRFENGVVVLVYGPK